MFIIKTVIIQLMYFHINLSMVKSTRDEPSVRIIKHHNESVSMDKYSSSGQTINTTLILQFTLKNKNVVTKKIFVGKPFTTTIMLVEKYLLPEMAGIQCILPTTFRIIDDIVSRSGSETLIIIHHPSIIHKQTIGDWLHRSSFPQKFTFSISEDVDHFYQRSDDILKEISRIEDEKWILVFTSLEITKSLFRLKEERFPSIQKDTWIVDKNIYPKSVRTQQLVMFNFLKYGLQIPVRNMDIQSPAHNQHQCELQNEKLK